MEQTQTEMLKGFSLKSEWVGTRPDNEYSQWHTDANHYKCVIRFEGKQYTFYYSMGPTHTSEPTITECLYSMSVDSRPHLENQSFEQFADEFGYDEDSRRGERIYKACLKQGEAMKRLLGGDFEDFVYCQNKFEFLQDY